MGWVTVDMSEIDIGGNFGATVTLFVSVTLEQKRFEI